MRNEYRYTMSKRFFCKYVLHLQKGKFLKLVKKKVINWNRYPIHVCNTQFQLKHILCNIQVHITHQVQNILVFIKLGLALTTPKKFYFVLYWIWKAVDFIINSTVYMELVLFTQSWFHWNRNTFPWLILFRL